MQTTNYQHGHHLFIVLFHLYFKLNVSRVRSRYPKTTCMFVKAILVLAQSGSCSDLSTRNVLTRRGYKLCAFCCFVFFFFLSLRTRQCTSLLSSLQQMKPVRNEDRTCHNLVPWPLYYTLHYDPQRPKNSVSRQKRDFPRRANVPAHIELLEPSLMVQVV